jgi:hypothetical protein
MAACLALGERWKINSETNPLVAAHRNTPPVKRFSDFEGREEAAMTDRKARGTGKDRPKTERPPVTARKPKETNRDDRKAGDMERATERSERDFDPNVNQRPR